MPELGTYGLCGGREVTRVPTANISSERKRRPLHTRLQTYRCVALTDASGHVWTAPSSCA